MKRAIAMTAVILGMTAPSLVSAKIDPSCSAATATSAVTGTVRNALNQALGGITVELSFTNSQNPTNDRGQTNGQGFYRICAGSGQNTYDVRARDDSQHPLYAAVSQPYSTWSTPTGDADFTPASGLPMLYMTNLRISPAEISNVNGPVDVEFVARSKAPAGTVMRLSIGHTGEEITMTAGLPEFGGPGAGGWNVWRASRQISQAENEALHWAAVAGYAGATRVTQIDRQPYVIDKKPPHFGPKTSADCGPGITIGGLVPPTTTNPMPIVLHGVCDDHSNGARSGLDPFSLTGKRCLNADLTSGCQTINPVLNTFSIVWYPSSPLAKGTYYFGWSIADYAGNRTTNTTGFPLVITDRGGQWPTIGAVTPGNIGSGMTGGVVVGSSFTSPNSFPSIGFRVSDNDGQRDLVPGTLTVRVAFGSESNVVYEYDPFAGPTDYDPVSRKGGGSFNLESGGFKATGYPLQGRPPGRYIATASITDHGGNTATVTWQWILAAAV